MASGRTILRGIVRGRSIELTGQPDLPEGPEVSVTLDPIVTGHKPGDGIRASAGAWADAGDELDAWLEEMQRGRSIERPDPAE
jgi:hypothetical protein